MYRNLRGASLDRTRSKTLEWASRRPFLQNTTTCNNLVSSPRFLGNSWQRVGGVVSPVDRFWQNRCRPPTKGELKKERTVPVRVMGEDSSVLELSMGGILKIIFFIKGEKSSWHPVWVALDYRVDDTPNQTECYAKQPPGLEKQPLAHKSLAGVRKESDFAIFSL